MNAVFLPGAHTAGVRRIRSFSETGLPRAWSVDLTGSSPTAWSVDMAGLVHTERSAA
jgi:hypothetical protein